MFLFSDKTIQMFSKRNLNKNYKHLPFINIACFISESLVLLRRGTDPGDPYSYTISDVDTDDTGLYSCLAGNILGETVHTAYLLVNNCNMLGHKMLICQLFWQTPNHFWAWERLLHSWNYTVVAERVEYSNNKSSSIIKTMDSSEKCLLLDFVFDLD